MKHYFLHTLSKCLLFITSLTFIFSPWRIYSEDIPDAVSLNGFSKVIVFAMVPTLDRVVSEKVNKVIEQSFSQIGEIHKIKTDLKAPAAEGVDLSGFDGDGTLIYEIHPITLSGKECDIVMATLTFYTNVTITKTKNEGNAVIWSSNYFINANLQKETEKLVSQSLNALLKTFAIKHTSEQKLIFNLYPS